MIERLGRMKGLNFNSISPMVWQPCCIEGEILSNIYSGTAASIYVKLHNYNPAAMWNESFKLNLHLGFSLSFHAMSSDIWNEILPQ